jgi:dTDP-4-amino-4,6-dideoxygalactose transaminase
VFAGYDYITVEGDVGGDIFERGLCLPSDIKMTEEEQEKVIQIISSCFE